MGDQASTGDWSSWIQGVASGVIDKAATAKWVQPYNTEQMRLQALGQAGLGYYTEGQRQGQIAPVVGISTNTLLIIGGVAVVALLLVKR